MLSRFRSRLSRIRRPWRAVLLLAVGLAGGATAAAVASVPDSAGVIHACVSTNSDSGAPLTTAANVTVIDPSVGQTCNTGAQESISWNATGPQGPTGPTGPQGPPGQAGSQGPPGTSTVIQPTFKTAGPGIGWVSMTGSGLNVRFPLLSFSWANKAAAPKAVRRGAAATLAQLSLTKLVDSTSPKLHVAVATGKHLASVTISLFKTAGSNQVGLVIKLEDVVISSIAMTRSAAGVSPLETLTLAFGKLKTVHT